MSRNNFGLCMFFFLCVTTCFVIVKSQAGAGGNYPNQVDNRQPPQKLSIVKIAEHPACADDVKRFCGEKFSGNNFAALGCLQYDRKDDADLSPECEHFLWNFKRNMTADFRFEAASQDLCGDFLKQIPECREEKRGLVVPCLIEHMDNGSSSGCREFLKKMARIVFSDYRLIYRFTETCGEDIDNFQCGRLHEEDDDKPHSQGKTIECLAEHLRELKNDGCRKEILRVAELQADDFNLDRPLYFACRDDRERFCPRVKAGSGRVYKCLFRHKFDREMSSTCRDKLTARQKLMQEDYKVNRPLFDACHKDLRHYQCMKGEDVPEEKIGRMSHVLVCLEEVMRDGKPVAAECVAEMRDMRRSLLEDYQITPNLVKECSAEIKDTCGGGLQREGKTLHCLMDLARKTEKQEGSDVISPDCRRELESLLEEADAGEDFEMDPMLREACAPVAKELCADVKPGEGRVINCLTDKLDHEKMSSECEERLLEIQFFIQRDMKLEVQLMHFCLKDAVEKCGMDPKPQPNQPQGASSGPEVFSCLYRFMKFAKNEAERLQPQCVTVIHHKLRQRAAAIDMEPQIQEKCMTDLSAHCTNRHGKGDEMECLQDHLEELQEPCRLIIGNFTEDEADDVEMDRNLMKACKPMIRKFCGDSLDKGETGEIMQCLVENKKHHDMNDKCRATIVHKQIIAMKDFRFTLKFKEACKQDVLQQCKGSKTKSDVLECLSTIMRDDVVEDSEPRLSSACRQQLRFELLQREENIALDPKISEPCKKDLTDFCSNVVPGSSAMLECLRKNQPKLSPDCHLAVFNRERLEAADANVDYLLATNCKRMIKQYCSESAPEEMFVCLRHHKDLPQFEHKCRSIVIQRMRQKAQNFQLDVELIKRCHGDIKVKCGHIVESAKTGGTEATLLQGQVISCLRTKFAKQELSHSCQTYMSDIVKESAMDYRQDLRLAKYCQAEIKTLCQLTDDDDGEDDHGRVTDCLKEGLLQKKITNHACIAEIARTLLESKADVQVDPMLHKACVDDIQRFCYDVPPGEGRLMSCLLTALDKKAPLKSMCFRQLSSRVELWSIAGKETDMGSLKDVYDQLATSPARNYFVTVFTCVVLAIFVIGMCCGRITKRIRLEMKAK